MVLLIIILVLLMKKYYINVFSTQISIYVISNLLPNEEIISDFNRTKKIYIYIS